MSNLEPDQKGTEDNYFAIILRQFSVRVQEETSTRD